MTATKTMRRTAAVTLAVASGVAGLRRCPDVGDHRSARRLAPPRRWVSATGSTRPLSPTCPSTRRPPSSTSCRCSRPPIAASSLDDQLAGDGPFTIFAPSNAAISEIPTNVLDSMLADPALLDSILSYHVVVGEALAVGPAAAATSRPSTAR